ncbi:MAG: flagellar motor switch protein FliN [Pseudomonadota bacterium]
MAELESAGDGDAVAAAATDSGDASDMDLWEQALAEQMQADSAAQQPASGVASAAGAEQLSPAAFQSLQPDGVGAAGPANLDLILDIPVTLAVELGRTKIQIRNLLQLAQGSVVELDRLAGEPMDVLVNGCLVAQGEVVVVNDKFGIRLTDIVSPVERVKKLR